MTQTISKSCLTGLGRKMNAGPWLWCAKPEGGSKLSLVLLGFILLLLRIRFLVYMSLSTTDRSNALLDGVTKVGQDRTFQHQLFT